MWSIIKKTGADIWDEMLKLLVFNVVWVLSLILILPWPFVTFGLFYTAKDIGDGKGITFSSPFTYGLQVLRPAYIWAVVNLAAFFGIVLNLNFYAGIEAQWARIVQIFVISLALFWTILQLVTLAMYPRLAEPSFLPAVRNAMILVGRHPLPIFAMAIGAALILFLSTFAPVIILLLSISVIVLLVNNVIARLVAYELEQESPDKN